MEGPGWKFWFKEDGFEKWVLFEDDEPQMLISQKRELDFFCVWHEGVYQVWAREICLQWYRETNPMGPWFFRTRHPVSANGAYLWQRWR